MEGHYVESALAVVRKKKPNTPKKALVAVVEKENSNKTVRKASDFQVSYDRKGSKGKRPEWNSSTIKNDYKLTPAELEARKKQRTSKHLGIAAEQLYSQKKQLLPMFNKYDKKDELDKPKHGDDGSMASNALGLETIGNPEMNHVFYTDEYQKKKGLRTKSLELVVPNNSVTNFLSFKDKVDLSHNGRARKCHYFLGSTASEDQLDSISTTVFPSFSCHRPVHSRQNDDGSSNYTLKTSEEELTGLKLSTRSKPSGDQMKKEKVFPPPWQNIYK